MISITTKYGHVLNEQTQLIAYNVYRHFCSEAAVFHWIKSELFLKVIPRVSEATGISTECINGIVNTMGVINVIPDRKRKRRGRKKGKSVEKKQLDVEFLNTDVLDDEQVQDMIYNLYVFFSIESDTLCWLDQEALHNIAMRISIATRIPVEGINRLIEKFGPVHIPEKILKGDRQKRTASVTIDSIANIHVKKEPDTEYEVSITDAIKTEINIDETNNYITDILKHDLNTIKIEIKQEADEIHTEMTENVAGALIESETDNFTFTPVIIKTEHIQ